MYSGKVIQELEIDKLKSERRNPVIADLFHRMKYMERRGSGLKKIVAETEELPGYSEKYKPEFYSTYSSFTVVLKNVNYLSSQKADGGPSGIGDGKKVISDDSITINITNNITINEVQKEILAQMRGNPKITAKILSEMLGIAERNVKNHIKTLKQAELIERVGSAKGGHWVAK